MKLRLAKKIVKVAGTENEGKYNDFQYNRAFARMARTKSQREQDRFWNSMMNRGSNDHQDS